MKRKLTAKEYTYVASMLFGLFFGAGNLIFPVHLGQMAGSNVWQAILGLLITGVGLPLLGVAALGISRSNGLFDLSSKVNRPYAMFFTCALYLTIGPFFAIPRCATTSFTVGLEQVLPQNGSNTLYLLLFSVAFFAAALFFDDAFIDFARGDVVGLRGGDRRKALVVPQIEVGLRTVFGDVALAVLVGVERPGIDVDVRVEFLHGNFVTSGF